MKNFAKLCTPAKIYFAIAVLAAIIELFNGVGILAIFLKLVFAMIWTCILGWLCKKGFHLISWFLVLLPYLVMFLVGIRLLRFSRENRSFLNSIKLQGVLGRENMATQKHTKK